MTKVSPQEYWTGPRNGPTPASHLPLRVGGRPDAGICQHCNHWEEVDANGRTMGGGQMDPPDGWKLCVLGETVAGGLPTPGSLMMGYDCESYQAGVYTAPTFGCVQFKART